MKTLTNTVFTGKWIVHTPHDKTHLHAFPPSSDWTSQRLRVSMLGLLQGALEQLRGYLCVCVCVCVCLRIHIFMERVSLGTFLASELYVHLQS